MISEISINGLFGRFNYRLPLSGDITVLTGPNGAGKSTLITLMRATSHGDERALLAVPFTSFSLTTDGGEVEVKRNGNALSFTVDGVVADSKKVQAAVGAVKVIGRKSVLSSALTDGDALTRLIEEIKAIPSKVARLARTQSQKAQLFIQLLDERTEFKKPVIDSDELYFIDELSGNKLSLAQLSSGELALMVFYYDLLFCCEDGALILIDEPETSLHILWQFTLIDDLSRALSLFDGAKAVVSTHSPQVLSNHRDLQVDLGEQYEG